MRRHGALIGLAVGDALGVAMNGRRAHAAEFPQLNDTPRLPVGGGSLDLAAGQPTALLQLAVVHWCALHQAPAFDVMDHARALVKWAERTAGTDELELTRIAAARLAEGAPPEAVGLHLWLERARRDTDYAPLIRALPVGVHFSAQREPRFDATVAVVQLTHFAPEPVLAAALLNGLVAMGVEAPTERPAAKAIALAGENELSFAAATLGRRNPDWVAEIKDAADALRGDLRAAQADDPELYGPELELHGASGRWARVVTRLALWHLFHAPNLEAAVLDAVNRGGEASATAALAGALFGAFDGASAVTAEWRERVIDTAAPEGSAWARYHPRRFLSPLEE